MTTRFQAAALVASPSYPNAVAWSDENLVAVASGHLVTILNPATPFGSRGLITIPSSLPFPIGVVERKDLLSGCLLSTCLSRDRRPCARSISWSPIGFAPNAGCLLAVCTTEGRVKLYRMPFCEYSAEWVEVLDISEIFCSYLTSVNFGELDVTSAEFSDEQPTQLCTGEECANDLPISVSTKGRKRGRQNALSVMYTVVEIKPGNSRDNNARPIVSLPKSKAKSLKKVPEKCSFSFITPDKYASRSAMLSSLVVSWSPILRSTSEFGLEAPNNSSNGYCILAAGGKSGKISFWRIHELQCYSIMPSRDPTAALLIGLLQAHCTWITSISWALYVSDTARPQLLLATGCSDGSVKIWLRYSEELLKLTEVDHAPFVLVKEVISVDSIPVSTLSLNVPVRSRPEMLLAIGKGSGSFDLWICDITTSKFDKAGSYDAHDHIVTGLSWAFGGCCLYSCSQDNSVRCWILHGYNLGEVPIPSNTPGVKSSTDVPNVFDSCFGLAVSPGNLVVAVARSFDADLLNPMYQARTQKAAIEFFWIGGQQLDNLSNRCLDFDAESLPGFPAMELVYWEHNILCSLNQYEHPDKPLVIWDIISALLAFKQHAPKYVERILLKWLVSYAGSQFGLSSTILSHASTSLSIITSRQLQLLNIIIRRVILPELKADKICSTQEEELNGFGVEQLDLWVALLLSSEKELRERLVGLSFSAVLNLMSTSFKNFCKPGRWSPVGIAQMEQWAALTRDQVKDHIKQLASEVGKLAKSQLHSMCEYVPEEQCSYCSAFVPFESTENAVCRGKMCNDGVRQSHKLARCAVSMQVCPTTPSWFCICCQRCASNLAPQALFTMAKYPSEFKSLIESPTLDVCLKPLCPFCGILLQRLQPEFLLSPSAV
ncbi:unnamed protein product [Ilex paraguariensis]|uniref:Transcription factor IIIC 90kDa subunit N-terminal domain-containing protein n=1 Tax=Ilex paraguariensis TaxID=185542 RepID=A0ABC8R9B2_9AQUA